MKSNVFGSKTTDEVVAVVVSVLIPYGYTLSSCGTRSLEVFREKLSLFVKVICEPYVYEDVVK